MSQGIGIEVYEKQIIIAVMEDGKDKPLLSHLFLIKGEKKEELASQISSLFQCYHLDRYRVVISQPTHSAIIRKISVPFVESRQIGQIILFEAEQHIQSRPIEELIVDYHILKVEEKNTRTLVTALPVENVEECISWIEALEIYPFAIDLDIMGLFYIAQVTSAFANQNVLILDIKNEVCNMLFLSSGQIEDARAMRIQVDSNFDQADPHSVVTPTQLPSPLLQQGIGRTEFLTMGVKATLFLRLIKEMRRTVCEFDSIYLCGEKDILEYLPVFLGKRLKVPIMAWDIASHISITENVDRQYVPLAGTAIGLALKALDKTKAGYNFRKGIFSSKKLSDVLKIPLIVFMTLLFFFSFFLAIYFHLIYKEKSRQYEECIAKAEKRFIALKPAVSLENVEQEDKIARMKEYLEGQMVETLPQIPDVFSRWDAISKGVLNIRKEYYFSVERLSLDSQSAVLEGRTESDLCFDRFTKYFSSLSGVKETQILESKELEDTKSSKLTHQYKFLIKFRE